MLAKRIIPCLDVKDGQTVKGVNFENLKLDGYNFKFTNMPFTDISSTELRQRIVENKPIDNLSFWKYFF